MIEFLSYIIIIPLMAFVALIAIGAGMGMLQILCAVFSNDRS